MKGASTGKAAGWLEGAIGRCRSLGFFQGGEAGPPVEGGEPGFGHVPLGMPRLAFAGLSDREAAQAILPHWRREWKEDPTDGDLLGVLEYDLSRVAHMDTECVSPGEDAYVDALHAVARISRGAFAPTAIEETWEDDEGPVHVTFRLGGKPHRLEPEPLGDMLDVNVLAEVNRLLAGSPCTIHLLETDGQDVFLVAFTEQEAKAWNEALPWKAYPVGERPKRPGEAEADAIFACSERGRQLLDEGDVAGAIQSCEEGLRNVAARRRLVPDDAFVPDTMEMVLLERLASARARSGQHEAALADLARALSLHRKAEGGGRTAFDLPQRGIALRILQVQSLRRLGRDGEAWQACGEALSWLGSAQAPEPMHDPYDHARAVFHTWSGDMAVKAGQGVPSAVGSYKAAEPLLARLVPLRPDEPILKETLDRVRKMLALAERPSPFPEADRLADEGDGFVRQGALDQAIARYQHAMRSAASAQGADADDLAITRAVLHVKLSVAQERRGDALAAQRRPREAQEAYGAAETHLRNAIPPGGGGKWSEDLDRVLRKRAALG